MMIQFETVSKRYHGFEALSNITLTIQQGDMVFITGHSGAGKSTFLRLIAPLERPTQGSVIVNGHNLAQLKPSTLTQLRRNVGMVFQDHHLLNNRNVQENVGLPLLVAGYRHSDIVRRVGAILEKVSLYERRMDLPSLLSEGERQRVSIARAMVVKPKILLADEPTGNLDADLSAEIMRLFEEFNRGEATVVVATHDKQLLNDFKHPVIRLHKGSLVRAA